MAVLVVGYLAVLTIGIVQPAAGLELSGDPLFNLPARFDAGWYGGIALDGYSFEGRFDKQQNLAFFPAMPLLMRTVGVVAGAAQPTAPRPMRMARALWAGVLISLISFAWAAHYLVRLARDTIGEPRALAAVALMAAYPFAVFFSAPYTEALFVLGAIAAFYHCRRAEWLQAATWGFLVGLTRPNGCFLTLALLCLVAESRWRRASGDWIDAATVKGRAVCRDARAGDARLQRVRPSGDRILVRLGSTARSVGPFLRRRWADSCAACRRSPARSSRTKASCG